MPDEEHWDWDFDSQANAHDHSEKEQESAPMGDNRSRKKLGSHNRTPSSTSQTHQAEHSLARGPRRPRNPSRIKSNTASSKGDDWDLVEDDKETISEDTWEGIANPTPSYDFPGTWDTAIHQTNHAVREVTVASKSYCTALYNSGITKAGYSIGSALAGTANRSALAVAGWAVQSTGTDTEQLPGGVQKWLRGKERLDEAKRSALNAEKARLARKYKRHIKQKGEAAEGNRSLPQLSEDSRESSPRRQSSDQTEEEWNDRSEDDDHGPVYLGQLDEELDYQSKNIVQRPSHSHRASSTLDTGFRTEDCRPIEEEHLISPMDSRVPPPDNKWAPRDQNSNSLFSSHFRFPKETSPEPSSAHIGPTLRDPKPTNSGHYNNPIPVAHHVPSHRAPQQEQYDKSSYPNFGNQSEGYFGRYAVQSNEPRQQYVTTPAAPFMPPRHAFNEEAPDDYERFQYMSAVSSLPVNPRQEEYEFQQGRKHEEEEYGMDFHGMFETE